MCKMLCSILAALLLETVQLYLSMPWENMSSGSTKLRDKNQPAQLHRLARIDRIWQTSDEARKYITCIIWPLQRTTD